ncbi:hypothetical protein BX666DRAFT_1900773 [Dichotomocladium elegans]|nr:hypothetical protein BX666DRAFT_1900773 [Dichotomocladium elegans]
MYDREKREGNAFDDATASVTTALYEQGFLNKTSDTTATATAPAAAVAAAQKTAPTGVRSAITGLSTGYVESSTAPYGIGTARSLQDAAVASWLRPLLQNYLLSPDPTAMGEKTVVILTGKVAQKSYGTEKRFLCPPPTVIFDGISWWTKATPPTLEVSMSGETSEIQEGQVDWFSVSGTIVGQTGFRSNANGNSNRLKSADKNTIRDWYRIPQHDPLAGGKCVLRQLYINDADEKRKRVECLARIRLADSTFTGTVSSKPIKVISKPSKKRSSVKNTDACIHHGSTVSLFNRIRSQTVSTKYLGVSSSTSQQPFMYPGQSNKPGESDIRTAASLPTTSSSDGTCFIARTGSWDPFAIWVVDTHWEKTRPDEHVDVDEYIGPSCAQALRNDVPYPPPPAIAAKNKTGQPLPIHYNQHIVLQCLTTGLVSPIMIIRKVDRAATVVGGANIKFYPQASEELHHPHPAVTPNGTPCGGEYGDEILGDPVSQLHKVALQIVQEPVTSPPPEQQHERRSMLPYTGKQPITYLACLNDMVGTHRSVHKRKALSTIAERDETNPRSLARRRIASTSSAPDFYYASQHPHSSRGSLSEDQPYPHHNHNQTLPPPLSNSVSTGTSKRGRSMSVAEGYYGESQSQSLQTTITPSWSDLGAYWYEDVSDSAVWSIVGTDYSKYTLWEPSIIEDELNDVQLQPQANQMMPLLLSYSRGKTPADVNDDQAVFLSIHGEYFSRELNVWFGDIRSIRSEYRSRELIICQVPTHAELTHAVGIQWKPDGSCSVPLLLVRNDGKAVYKTNKYYSFC